MKVLFINRKQLGVTLILIGLMLTLFAFEKTFEDKLKVTLLIQNDIKYLKQYNIAKEGYSYKLPSEWETEVKSFKGGEILYHNDFQSGNAVVHGFVEVLKIKDKLKLYLENSKVISEKQNKVYDYSISEIKVKDMEGYAIHYKIEVKPDLFYVATEYFIDGKDIILRFSFFVREDNYKENMPAVFNTIVRTIERIKG